MMGKMQHSFFCLCDKRSYEMIKKRKRSYRNLSVMLIMRTE